MEAMAWLSGRDFKISSDFWGGSMAICEVPAGFSNAFSEKGVFDAI